MKIKKMLVGLSVIALISLLSVCASAADLRSDEVSVAITTTAPAVGRPIETQLSAPDAGNVSYKWTVASVDTGTAADSYTPTAADYESWIEVFAIDDVSGETLASDRIYFSRLPVVYIETENGQPVVDRDNYIGGTMLIQGNSEYEQQYSGEIEIKGRGTSSWHYAKKPYKLKLDSKSDLFGFGKSKHYVLLANYLDPSLMRNTIGYKLSARLGLTAADTAWVDVVFNGEYAGNYQLCEHIRIGPQLVDITDWEEIAKDAADAVCSANPEAFGGKAGKQLEDMMTEDLSWLETGTVLFDGTTYSVSDCYDIPDDLSGGYLFELDDDAEKEPTHFTTENGIKVIVSKPEHLSSGMTDYVRGYMQDYEDAICSIDGYNGSGQHYTELADFDSMLAYWLTMEILSNEDAASRSRFCYKPVGEKLVFGPAWDFDIGAGSFRSYFGARGWSVTGTVVGWYTKQDFFKEFTDDPYFQVKAQEKYWEIRDYLELLVKDGGIIDSCAEYLYELAAANELLWTGDGYMTRSFSGEYGDVSVLKGFLKARFKWLDSVFDTEDSTTRGLRSDMSSHTYSRSGRVAFSIENGAPDGSAHGAEYVINEGEDIRLSVKVPSSSAVVLYINGIKYGSYGSDELSGGISVPSGSLTEEKGSKNVISVIARSGRRTYTNYTTVRISSGGVSAGASPLSDAPETICAEHELTAIDERAATGERYGLVGCWYCNVCHRYFADASGSEILPAKDAIISLKTCDSPGGIREKLKLAAVLAAAVLAVLIAAVVLLIRRRRKRAKNRA